VCKQIYPVIVGKRIGHSSVPWRTCPARFFSSCARAAQQKSERLLKLRGGKKEESDYFVVIQSLGCLVKA